MCDLRQAAMLDYNNLIHKLKQDRYSPIPNTDSNWHHEKYLTIFCLCINNFGVKHFNKHDLNHLINSLQKKYKISTHYSGTNL